MLPLDLVSKIELNHASELLKKNKTMRISEVPIHRVLMTPSILAPYLRNSIVKSLKLQ
jgi:hypothetical protein|tara:strand:- start:181 stop:354 length:174 start_codon:yes stop_codon:yes gene_type:complete